MTTTTPAGVPGAVLGRQACARAGQGVVAMVVWGKRLGRLAALVCGAAALGAWCEASAAPAVAPVLIELAWQAGPEPRLLLSYTPPPGVRTLRLPNDSAAAREVWREWVRPADACSRWNAADSQLELQAPCSAARFTVEPRLLMRPAVYQAAQPLGEGGAQGVLLHTGFWVAAAPGAGLRWRWLPPAGEGALVLQRGRVHRAEAVQGAVEELIPAAAVDALLSHPEESAHWRAAGAAQYVALGRLQLQTFDAGVLLHDDQVDPARRQAVLASLQQAAKALQQAYGQPLREPAAVVLTAAAPPGFQADVSDGHIMRLRLPLDPQHLALQELQRYLLHEATHWWNMGLYRSDDRYPWLHEGHAEWASLLLMQQAAALSPQALLRFLDEALNRCLVRRAEHAAATLAQGYHAHEDPYACGLVLMLGAQLQRAAGRPRAPGWAWADLATLHRQAPSSGVSQADFARWADLGAATGPMQQLLGSNQQGFAQGFTALMKPWLQAQDLSPSDDAQLPWALRELLALDLAKQLLSASCEGELPLQATPGGLLLPRRMRCQRLLPGQFIVRLQGIHLLDQPLAAAQAVRQACATGQTLRAGQGIHESPLQCPTTWTDPPVRQLWHWRPEVVQGVGLMGASQSD
ncbi:hypothetical protein ACG0Z6_11200 [Roseateles sp. BYS180W]|uniref:Peptidase M61 catalytic domain-containing protein n=1 Tax=Roseateles rivi TaxID=3299028 RepID=A0ABW7FWX1_9BURK